MPVTPSRGLLAGHVAKGRLSDARHHSGPSPCQHQLCLPDCLPPPARMPPLHPVTTSAALKAPAEVVTGAVPREALRYPRRGESLAVPGPPSVCRRPFPHCCRVRVRMAVQVEPHERMSESRLTPLADAGLATPRLTRPATSRQCSHKPLAIPEVSGPVSFTRRRASGRIYEAKAVR